MKISRLATLLALAIIAAASAWWSYNHFLVPSAGATVTVYYTKMDGQTEVPWTVSLGPARDPQSVAFYAAAQALAGPPPDVEAVRFPDGALVRAVHIDGAIADVDLGAVRLDGGSFAESGAFESLVWTMTALPGVTSVQVRIDGNKVTTLPGGHLELDAPLTRSSW